MEAVVSTNYYFIHSCRILSSYQLILRVNYVLNSSYSRPYRLPVRGCLIQLEQFFEKLLLPKRGSDFAMNAYDILFSQSYKDFFLDALLNFFLFPALAEQSDFQFFRKWERLL